MGCVMERCGLAVLMVLGGWAHAGAEPVANIRAIVRVYNAFGVSGRDLAKAQATASEIFAAGGIDIQWRVCPSRHSGGDVAQDPCANPLGDVEVSMRLVRGDRRHEDRDVLGVSMIDTVRHTGSLASVFPDRVSDMALRARVPYATLLGRAFAHEVGHLFLGTSAHSSRGVMRPRWTLSVLRTHAVDDWLFSRGDAVRLALALRSRTASSQAPTLAAMILP